MNVLEIKGSIFDLLWGIEDTDTLLKIQSFVSEVVNKARRDDEDWWDELTPEQQEKLDQALKDVEEGKNLIPHDAVIKEIEERFKTLTNGK